MNREFDVGAGRGRVRERLWTRFLSCLCSRGKLLATIASAVSVAFGPFDSASASDIDTSLVQRGRYVATAGNGCARENKAGCLSSKSLR
jgi:hypothetical protein